MPPRSEYLLFEDQPARTTLYTPNDDIARRNRIPILRSAITNPVANGTTANDIRAVATTMAGARTKTGLSAKGGIQSSFVNSLIESATICPSPKGPTRFGPYRSCHSASSRRSTQINPADRLSTTKRTTIMTSTGKRFGITGHLLSTLRLRLVKACRRLVVIHHRAETIPQASQLFREVDRRAV